MAEEKLVLQEAQAALDKHVQDCQIAAYDKYRTALEGRLAAREEALATIRKAIEDEAKNAPAAGAQGARCEKALSLGTGRPKRVTEVDAPNGVCGAGLCCGAARVWMAAGDGEADAAWRTIETCQTATD